MSHLIRDITDFFCREIEQGSICEKKIAELSDGKNKNGRFFMISRNYISVLSFTDPSISIIELDFNSSDKLEDFAKISLIVCV